MKLGIVSDIHEALELLQTALDRFERLDVDRVVILGDIFETGPRVNETVALLAKASAVGVYGNHDYGLSVCPREEDHRRFAAEAVAFMTTLVPRMEIDGCLFVHREPWLDGSDLCDIWHVDEEPLTLELIVKSFDAAPHPAIFAGHFHRWIAMTRQGRLEWDGSTPITLSTATPTMIIVNGVCEGYAATFDTTTGLFTPLDLYEGVQRPTSRPVPRCYPSQPTTIEKTGSPP